MSKVLARKIHQKRVERNQLRTPPKKKNFNSQPRENTSPGKRGNDRGRYTIRPTNKTKNRCIIGGSKFCKESINSIKSYQHKLKNAPQTPELGDREESVITSRTMKRGYWSRVTRRPSNRARCVKLYRDKNLG